tara:strand:+ start:63 stop:194 length:132 start_codon:yes stop_codon:yes gene_type:complete
MTVPGPDMTGETVNVAATNLEEMTAETSGGTEGHHLRRTAATA